MLYIDSNSMQGRESKGVIIYIGRVSNSKIMGCVCGCVELPKEENKTIKVCLGFKPVGLLGSASPARKERKMLKGSVCLVVGFRWPNGSRRPI